MSMKAVSAIILFLALLIHCIIERSDTAIIITIKSDSYPKYDYINEDDIRTARALGSGSDLDIQCCIYGNCSCPSLHNALTNLTSNILINITTDVELSSVVPLVDLANITISGYKNPTVYCNNFGGLHFITCYNCTIKGIVWEGCGSNDTINKVSVLQLHSSCNITIENCTFKHSTGQAVMLSGISGYVLITNCYFLSNKLYEGHGTAIYHSSSTLSVTLNFMIANCSFSNNERAKSVVYLGHSSNKLCELFSLQDSKFHYNKGVPIYLTSQSLIISGQIEFIGNFAENGGAIFISNYSTVSFHSHTVVNFKRNTAINNGGAIFLCNHSNILFKDHPLLQKYNECQLYDLLHVRSEQNIKIMFIFYHNNAVVYGQDIYAHNSKITIGQTSALTFNGISDNNDKSSTVYAKHQSILTFEGNSTVTFYNIQANEVSGGAAYVEDSIVTFKGNSIVHFNSNKGAYSSGGAMSIAYCTVTFKENSTVIFSKNSAGHGSGGALYVNHFSTVSFEGNSEVNFYSNSASFHYGGAMYMENHCTVTFKGNTNVTFDLNLANKGGAIYISTLSTLTFDENSTINFIDNVGSDGGVMYIYYYSNVIFKGNSTAKFKANKAEYDNGGALYIYYSHVKFQGSSVVIFDSNHAFTNGGVLYIHFGLYIVFEENSTVHFINNKATNNGAGIYISKYAMVKFEGYTKVTFNNSNAGTDGGAIYVDNNSAVRFGQYSTVVFNNNTATFGGSAFVRSSEIGIEGKSSINFTNNAALQDGGAIYLSDHSSLALYNNSSVQFYYNTASDYGGAIYVSLKESTLNFNSSDIKFKDNSAGTIQKPVYINVPKSCDSSCIFHKVLIITRPLSLATSPSKLLLNDPVKCIKGNNKNCSKYYLNNIMLGQKITFDACLLDYFDQPTEAAEFSITGMIHQDYNISGSEYITVSCNHSTQAISVIGNMHSNNSYNYSITLSLYVARISESKIVSINVTVELSQCDQYPGFWYSSKSLKCECYKAKDIISCSGSNSTIRRGYWYGSVEGKPTVTPCPNDYCNFTCCEIKNGIYHLSPVRANQCKPHRSGIACGNCEKGYTLSFDSPECVAVSKCTTGITVLVISLSFLYWIVVVLAVFVISYFKITIGSLYAIVYYYSVVDIMLGQVLFISNGLYTTVNIMSSLAKLIPQFLGKLCLVKNMSGIDQQFIHYINPTVFSLILIIVIVLARSTWKPKGWRAQDYLYRGSIDFICFFLLLSYTSMTVTSVLLMRSLKFMDIDKVYTYLSPDIEYFHGRHLAYVIVAVIIILVITFGLPLLLLLEPFLNSKVNFFRIKPLLDNFQGCYKAKYRSFASYYMICRLVVFLLIFVKIFDEFTTQYLLLSSCALMQLIHVLVRPYADTIHNVFDGIILQMIVIISALPIIKFVDNYDESFVLVIAYILVICPIMLFTAMKFWINKKSIYYSVRRKVPYTVNYSRVSHDDDERDGGKTRVKKKKRHDTGNDDKIKNKIHKIPTTIVDT